MAKPSSSELQLPNPPTASVQPPALSQDLVAPPSAPPAPSRPQELPMYKNRLQEFTQRSSIALPVYQTTIEGTLQAPRFRSTVLVDGTSYTSANTFSNRKTAEQDVAKYALECISKKLKDDGCPCIREDTIFCKSILHEFAVKMDLDIPTYTSIQPEGLLPIFVSSLVFNGATYRGDIGRTKKEAEQLAARAAILSLLEDSRYRTFLSEIIKSKAKLYVALNKVKDSSISHLGTTSAGSNTLIQNNEAETAAVGKDVPATGSIEQISGTVQPYHEFKLPKSEVTETTPLPIAFVPPMAEHDSVVGESSSRKRRRKKKKAKLDANTRLAAATSVPLNQTPPCSVAQ